MAQVQKKIPLESGHSLKLIPLAATNHGACYDVDDPAIHAFTDFRSSPMIATSPRTTIEDALQHMRLSGARFLFVVGDRGQLLGSVTSYDIQGEKPLRHMQSVGCTHTTCAWRDVLVEDVMEPVADWLVMDHRQIARLRLGDIAAHLAERAQRYLIVVEHTSDGAAHQVRGLFSAARIQQLLSEARAVQGAGIGKFEPALA